MQCSDTSCRRRLQIALCLALVTIVSFFTYVRDYDQPAALFWDENYHIASAQKYLNKVFFSEPHPPLGKLIIALGEYTLAPNEKTDQFLDVDYGTGEKLPENFSFAGYRLFPTLLAWLTAPLIFMAALTISESIIASLMVSAFYTFDNAIIVHSRSAMLESTQIFFVVLALLSFFTIMKRDLHKGGLMALSLMCGAAIGAAIATKVNALLLVILIPLLAITPRYLSLKLRAFSLVLVTISSLVIYFGVWRVHFLLGERRIEQLADSGYFSLSPEIRSLVDSNQQTTLGALPRLWRENAITFISRYSDGVPRLDLSKADENGSPPYFWPIGARAIQYRWEAAPENAVKYLYLVSNPASWAFVLIAVALSLSLLVARVVFPSTVRLKNVSTIAILVTLYCGYLFGMIQITRVLYLYHYFVGLIFAYLLTAVALAEVGHVGPFELTTRRKTAVALAAIFCSFVSFLWYSPLTYYKPIADHQFRSRALVGLWDLICVGCPRTSRLVKPPTPTILTIRFSISGIAPEEVEQDWGTPQIGVSATGKPLINKGIEYPTGFGMHSNAGASYPLQQRFSRFTADVGLPDYLKDSRASVTFQVIGDDKTLWESPIIKPGETLTHVDLDVSKVEHLILKILDGGDGITDDHAFWANLALTPKTAAK